MREAGWREDAPPRKIKTASGMDSKTFSKIVVLALMIDQLDVDIYMTPHFSINICFTAKKFLANKTQNKMANIEPLMETHLG